MTKEELEFVTWLSRVNQDLGRYIVRLMDETNPLCTTEYTTDVGQVATDLAHALTEAAQVIRNGARTPPRQSRGSGQRALHAQAATDHTPGQPDLNHEHSGAHLHAMSAAAGTPDTGSHDPDRL
ncbi:hypothetical protein [Saccharothrix variisporea]|uniref:hypothetical protein n=1 Tax=Saccharothrix variisporea TaxID=543527 RepID=UPI0037CA9599